MAAPAGMCEELALTEAARAGFTEAEHPRDPGDGKWIKHANWSDSRDGTTGYRRSTIGEAGDYHGQVYERHAEGAAWNSKAKQYDWHLSRQRTVPEGTDERGSHWTAPLGTGTAATMTGAKSAAMTAMKAHRKAHIAAGGDVGYNPSLHEARGVTRADWDPAKHPRVPGGKSGGRFTSRPGGGGRSRPEPGPWSRSGEMVTYHGSLGIDRSQMPQLSGVAADGKYHPSSEMVPKFMAWMRAQGVHVQERRVAAASLLPTQTTGDAKAIRGIADSLKSGELADTKPITVSLDRRVLDGHHNWAARLLADAEGGTPGLGVGMRVVQVGVPMTDLIEMARAFAATQGIRPRATGVAGNPQFARRAGLPLLP
jgi:hypothetical protein